MEKEEEFALKSQMYAKANEGSSALSEAKMEPKPMKTSSNPTNKSKSSGGRGAKLTLTIPSLHSGPSLYTHKQSKQKTRLSSLLSKIKSKDIPKTPKTEAEEAKEDVIAEDSVNTAEAEEAAGKPVEDEKSAEKDVKVSVDFDSAARDTLSFISSDEEELSKSLSTRKERIDYTNFSQELDRKSPSKLDQLLKSSFDSTYGEGSSLGVLNKVRSRTPHSKDETSAGEQIVDIFGGNKSRRIAYKRKMRRTASIIPISSKEKKDVGDITPSPPQSSGRVLKRAKTDTSLPKATTGFFSYVKEANRAVREPE